MSGDKLDPKDITSSPHRRAYEEFLQLGEESADSSRGLYACLLRIFPVKARYCGAPETMDYKLTLTGCQIDRPSRPAAFHLDHEGTYGCAVKLDLTLNSTTPDGNSKSAEHRGVTAFSLPLFTDRDTLIIDGRERVPVVELAPRPGLYFEEEDRGISALVRPERGGYLKIHLEAAGDGLAASVIVDFRVLDLEDFLRALPPGGGEAVKKIFGKMLPHAMWPEGETRRRLSPDVEEAIHHCKHLFHERRYDLGHLGRTNINRRLSTLCPHARIHNMKTPHLTQSDVAGMLAYLVGLWNKTQSGDMVPGTSPDADGYFYDDLSDLANRDALLLSHQVELLLLNGLGGTIQQRLEALPEPSKLEPRLLWTDVRRRLAKLFKSDLCRINNTTNPISEVSLKREVISTGPHGIHYLGQENRENRVVHPSHYGRLCVTETPESEKIGFTLHLALAARVNPQTRRIETPFKNLKTNRKQWIPPEAEKGKCFSPGNTSGGGQYRGGDGQILWTRPPEVHFEDAYRGQFLGVAAGLIPFIQHDDNNRAMMGAKNMMQAVPLLKPQQPIISTGWEDLAARLSGRSLYAPSPGTVKEVRQDRIVLSCQDGKEIEIPLEALRGTVQKTVTEHRPVVSGGDRVKKGQVLADGAGTLSGQLALGTNLLVAYMPYYGYNFEDGIVISDRLVREDVLTSLHVRDVVMEVRGDEAMTYREETGSVEVTTHGGAFQLEITSTEAKIRREEKGLARAARTRGRGLCRWTAEILQDRASRPAGKMGEKASRQQRTVKIELTKRQHDWFSTNEGVLCYEGQEVNRGDTLFMKYRTSDRSVVESLRSPVRGTVIGIHRLNLHPGARGTHRTRYRMVARILEERRIEVGDKLMGRHGNKGVVARIVPEHEMPHLEDGTAVDILLNPHGVISRMNLGQILETHCAWLVCNDPDFSRKLAVVPPFETVPEDEILSALKRQGSKGIDDQGKFRLIDGRTGRPFRNRVVVGYQYFMKLNHLVADKIHARETGPYSLMTQQPTKGAKNQGGQRLGEMEAWALSAHLAWTVLQEFFTLKSDEVNLWNEKKPLVDRALDKPAAPFLNRPMFPESLRSAAMFIRALGLDITFLDGNPGKEIPLHFRIPGGSGAKRVDHPGAIRATVKVASAERIREWGRKEVTDPQRPRFVADAIRVHEGSLYDPEIFLDKRSGYAYREKMAHIALGHRVLHPLLVGFLREDCRRLLKESIKDIAEYRKVLVSTGGEGDQRDEREVTWDEFNTLANLADARGGVDLLHHKIDQKIERIGSSGCGTKQKLEAFREKVKQCTLSHLPVLPLAYRPLKGGGGEREDVQSSLNMLYTDVLLCSNKIKELRGRATTGTEGTTDVGGAPPSVPAPVLLRQQRRLWRLVRRLMLGDARLHRQGKQALADMIQGKDGILRMFLLGKRVDVSGRSVIVPDPSLKPDQFRLPYRMAVELMTSRLVSRLRETARASNKARAVRMLQECELPENKCLIWPAIEDELSNKVCLLIRAPSLHKYNVLAFYPVLTDRRTIGLHPLACGGYNADFDGDSMSVFIPLTKEAQQEAREKCLFTKHLLSVRDGETVLHLDQDIVLGVYLMTRDSNGLRELKGLFKGLQGISSIKGPVTKKLLKRMVLDYIRQNEKNPEKVHELIQKVMLEGFRWATEEGVTFSIFDVPYISVKERKDILNKVKRAGKRKDGKEVEKERMEKEWKKRTNAAVKDLMGR